MKIQGTGSTSKTDKSKKSSKSSSGSGVFGTMLTASDIPETSSMAQSQAVTNVEALLAAQAAEDPTERKARKRMRERGEQLLNEMEKIRLTLMSGQLTVGHLLNLADIAATHKENISDPLLTEILAEIDLRAQVEIAKMRISMDSVV